MLGFRASDKHLWHLIDASPLTRPLDRDSSRFLAMDFVKELLEYVRHASVSTDPAFAGGMKGAREHACDLLDRKSVV